jgi:hypothetical protein
MVCACRHQTITNGFSGLKVGSSVVSQDAVLACSNRAFSSEAIRVARLPNRVAVIFPSRISRHTWGSDIAHTSAISGTVKYDFLVLAMTMGPCR